MIRKYIWDGTAFVERQRSPNLSPYVQGDITEKGGRRQFREHLKATNQIEMGHSDIRAATEKWNSRKADHAEKVRSGERLNVRPSDAPVMEARMEEASRIQRAVANRLDGRPMPDRKMLIKIALEEARRK